MNREEFITKLFSLYATTFNKGNGQAWTDAYKQVLKPNIDYDKLYDFMLSNYAGASAPSPAFLLKNAVYIQEQKTEEPAEFPTIIVKKGSCEYEYGLEDNDYLKHIEYFKRLGMQIIKIKYCDKNCQRCNYNHACITAKELTQCS